jgi:hypothetical protein
MCRLLVVIPTYARPVETVVRCLESVRRAVPAAYLGPTVVVDQNPAPLALPAWATVLRAEPGYPGPRRHLGAVAAAREAGPDDLFLFLDDDIELADWRRFPRLLAADDPEGLLARPETGCVQVSTRWWQRTAPRTLGETGGGILVRAGTYFDIGGYGEDYLDDVELFARALIAGRRNWQTGALRSLHHYGAGGLKAYTGLGRAGRSHLSRSRLDETYRGVLLRDWRCWTGYRFAPAAASEPLAHRRQPLA